MTGRIDKILGGEGLALSYEKAKELAGHEDEEVRAELAGRLDLKPEILYFLAEDSSPRVRRLIAENPATPHHADLLLARDDDQDVRGGLAEKISRLAPDMNPDEQDKVKRMAYEALELLTRDQVTRVRQILAEALKDVAEAPPDVIRRLAFDTEIVVAGPILEFSPVLTDSDLLEIIQQGTSQGRLDHISRRRQVSAALSDAIAATGDETAVGLLLANPSAQIREETLDRIIDAAVKVESWHAPLVARPKLSGRAALRLAHFVAANLIEILAERHDLEPDVLDEVRRVVDQRIDAGDPGFAANATAEADTETDTETDPGTDTEPKTDTATPLEMALEEASKRLNAGELTLAWVERVLGQGTRESTMAALAVLSDIAVTSVQRAVVGRNQKGIVALAWKAGLTPELAEKAQCQLLGIEAADVLKGEPGTFPMTDNDMEWQLELIGDTA